MTHPSASAHTATEVLDERRTLRKNLLQQRRKIDPDLRRQWDDALAQRVVAWCEKESPTSLAVYSPIQSEPDLSRCYAHLSAMGIVLAFPLVNTKNAPLQFLAWQVGDLMTTDEFGIPVPSQRDRLITPDAILIPCVGFNDRNYRLGYGGGFYDRTLSMLQDAIPLGVAYDCQKVDFSESEHDVPMSLILTEKNFA